MTAELDVRPPPQPEGVEAADLDRLVAEGVRRYAWSAEEVDFVRGLLGIVRAKALRAGEPRAS